MCALGPQASYLKALLTAVFFLKKMGGGFPVCGWPQHGTSSGNAFFVSVEL
jgi:hypothetical protein